MVSAGQAMTEEAGPLPIASSEGSKRATFYKVVAVVDGKFFSIFDGRTMYKLSKVTAPPNGCWVCPSLSAVLHHATRLPLRSALLDVPRAILRVSGWKEFHLPIPDGHASNHSKTLVTHVLPLDVLPYDELMRAAGLSDSMLPTTPDSRCRAGVTAGISVAGAIDAFDRAFPNLTFQLLRCSGQLAINCGPHAYDGAAWLTFHSCATEMHAPSPVVIRVLLDASVPLQRPCTLATALCDVEACLHWMRTTAGPCELLLVAPGGAFWEDTDLAFARATPIEQEGHDRVRGGASPFAALLPPASWAGETTHRIVEVPCSGTYVSYPVQQKYPRLSTLVASHALTASARPVSADPVMAASSTRAATPRAASARAAVEDARICGLTIGTAWHASGASCAELVAARQAKWAMPSARIRSIAATFACMELQLPPTRDEPERHAMLLRKLAATENTRRVEPHDAKRYPSPRGVTDVFPERLFKPAEMPLARHEREAAESFDKACRTHRAKLFSHACFRSGAAFAAALLEAKAKQASRDTTLDELDLTVLRPPKWRDVTPRGPGPVASTKRWL